VAAASDLTTLAAVRSWLGQQGTDSDPLLLVLITAWSRALGASLSIPVLSTQFTERYDGTGSSRLMLRQFPVTSVTSVSVDNVAVAASSLPGAGQPAPNGWLLEPWDGSPPGGQQCIDLFGSCFARGRQNIAVTYQAGYLTVNEPAVIAAATATVLAPNGPWAADAGVTYNGTALAKVSGAPGALQYQLDAAAPGRYIFNAADNNKAVLISYSYVPADIAHVVTALVGEDFRYKSRIGEVSKTLGGQETVTYSQADIPARYKTFLENYTRVVPV
jgi:hypothetical protein